MLSLTHLLLLGLVITIFIAPQKLSGLGRGLNEGMRNFRKSLKGEEDIDITHTIKRLDDDGNH